MAPKTEAPAPAKGPNVLLRKSLETQLAKCNKKALFHTNQANAYTAAAEAAARAAAWAAAAEAAARAAAWAAVAAAEAAARAAAEAAAWAAAWAAVAAAEAAWAKFDLLTIIKSVVEEGK
jgi:hypothetical protein